jgi:hypothetical protein
VDYVVAQAKIARREKGTRIRDLQDGIEYGWTPQDKFQLED